MPAAKRHSFGKTTLIEVLVKLTKLDDCSNLKTWFYNVTELILSFYAGCGWLHWSVPEDATEKIQIILVGFCRDSFGLVAEIRCSGHVDEFRVDCLLNANRLGLLHGWLTRAHCRFLVDQFFTPSWIFCGPPKLQMHLLIAHCRFLVDQFCWFSPHFTFWPPCAWV